MSAIRGTSDVERHVASGESTANGSAPPSPTRTVEEVRVAMALNGGVSLAVWMGGCAVELDAARRAHLGPEDLRLPSELARPEPTPRTPGSDRTIYHALCTAFHRQLMIDLMSGSSAGGINGALLAAAIDRKRRLHPDFIREKWLHLGDFETLLHPLRTESPTSLMGGHAFFLALRRTFRELLPTQDIIRDLEPAEEPAWQRAQEQLELPANQQGGIDALDNDVKLDVTATDVVGSEQRFRDSWGEELVATEYRERFRFRGRADYDAQRLAMAARASASFPLAFEPWAVGGEMLDAPGRRWLIDGGVLDNAPIRAVLDLIPARASDRPVRRFLCYLNADPPLAPTFDPAAELDDANDPKTDDTLTKPKPGGGPAARPQLQDVVGYVIGLPRKASFVDQLRAIQHAANRSTTVDTGESELLALDEQCLAVTAEAVLPAYRSRRRLSALEEMLEQPADVAIVAERLARLECELPWIPSTLEVPLDPPMHWGWGARAAERVLHLLLDVSRPRLETHSLDPDPAAREELVDARRMIFRCLAKLDRIHTELVTDGKVKALMRALIEGDDRTVPATICALRCLMREPDRDPAIIGIVQQAAHAAFSVRADLGSVDGTSVSRALFGPAADPPEAQFGDEHFTAFLRRALQIEVVRRAFNAGEVIESEQPLHFAQLTPCAPTLLWTSTPLHPGREVPARPDDKLTGTRWGHFAAFYRASWRANDFMWGRLDAAVRIVDMLLPAERPGAADGPRPDPKHAAAVLADALLPQEAFAAADAAIGPERRWLVAETLADAATVPAEEQHRAYEWRSELCGRLKVAARDQLRSALDECIAEDLTNGVDGHAPRTATRALCVRAAQWEILCRELPVVIKTSRDDRSLGTAVRPLEAIPADGKSWEKNIRELREEKAPLPKRLGVDAKAEQASALMIRTASHGALVGFSALRETRLPGSPVSLLPRALLLPVAGMVARRWWPYPFSVALAFWSFALVVAARVITLDSGDAAPWELERWLSVGTTWLGVGGIVMVCLVPFWRFMRSGSWGRRLTQGLCLLALVAAGGGLGIALALRDPDVRLVNVVAQTGSEAIPATLAGFALAVVGLFRLLPSFLPGPARRLFVWILNAPWKGGLSLGIFLLPWIALGIWALTSSVWDAAWSGASQWTGQDAWTARIAIFAPCLVAAGYVLFSVQRRGAGLREWLRSNA